MMKYFPKISKDNMRYIVAYVLMIVAALFFVMRPEKNNGLAQIEKNKTDSLNKVEQMKKSFVVIPK